MRRSASCAKHVVLQKGFPEIAGGSRKAGVAIGGQPLKGKPLVSPPAMATVADILLSYST